MGCRNSWGANKLLARLRHENGIPTMLLFADAFDDRVASWEHCVDKIERVHARKGDSVMIAAGCDVGSLTAKAVILNDTRRSFSHALHPIVVRS
ncbi:MAG: hypothetical protein MZU91_00190 [Desulfosudis oleivorans]|nr:hypothetical protein [Desulfosudis oleivorans]